MNLPELSVNRRVATFMLFLAVVLLGGIVLSNLQLDMLPDIEPPVINVITPWPGASASDIEQKVTKMMEDQLSQVAGLDEIYSQSLDNLSVVTARFKWGTDLDVKMGDIRDIIPLAKQEMPDDIEEPVLLQITSGMVPVLGFSLATDSNFESLHHFAENVVIEELSRVPGVGTILSYGGKRREIQVNLDLDRLDAYRMPPNAIIAALEQGNVNIPAGSLKQGKTEYYLRVPGRFESVDDIRSLVVGEHEGRPVYLEDVASVEDDFAEQNMYGWHYLQPSIFLAVQKNSDANTVEVSRMLHERLEELYQSRFPPGVTYHVALDTADFIINSLKNLTISLLAGILLVFLVTWIFLRRLPASLVVCGAIPFSLIITFIAMGWLDYTINIFTLSALAVASGMVVDNSIVATDQIIHHIELGERKHIAAVLGSSEVGSALTASTLTTAVVLLPLAFISGLVGVFFASLVVVMVLAVAASLFVSLSFIPMMGSKFFSTEGGNNFLQKRTERLLSSLEARYEDILSWSLDNKWKIIAVAVVIMGLTFYGLRFIGTELTPEPDTGDVNITFTLPEGTRIEQTNEFLKKVISYSREEVPEAKIIYGYDGMDEEGLSIAIGEDAGSNIGTVGLKLVDKSERKRSAFEVAQVLRRWLEQQPGVGKMTVQVTSPIKAIFLGAKPLNIEVYGDDLDEVVETAETIRNRLAEVPGAVDLAISQKQDRPEIWTEIDREKAAMLGVSTASAAQTMRTYYYGYETDEFFWEGEEDYNINVRLQESQRNSLDNLDRLLVPSETGSLIRLSSIASVKDMAGPPQIQRKNKQRYVTVEGNVQGRSLGDVTEDSRQIIGKMDIPEGIRISYGGEIEEQEDAFRQMGYLVLLGILLVYMVMAGQYEAYLDPFVIMFSIPFALSGVVVAYLATGLYLSLQGALGGIMLIGIVVNNAIVLVDYINLVRARGYKLREGLLEAGRRRLRPILMTTMTTFFGMTPMALSRGMGAEMWRPIAVSVMGGLAVSMIVSLVLVPVVYFIMEDKIRKNKRFQEARKG